jgi:hypothetical protein
LFLRRTRKIRYNQVKQTGFLVMPDSTPPQAQSSAQALAEKKTREQKWLEENRDGIEAYNKYIEEHGLPLAEFRVF